MKRDVQRFVNDFHVRAKLVKACTAYFLALIPKVTNPLSFRNIGPFVLLDAFIRFWPNF